MEMQGDRQLEGIEGADLAGEAVARDKILGAVVMRVEETNDLISPACDVGREQPSQAGEFGWVERTGSDLDGVTPRNGKNRTLSRGQCWK